MTSNLVASPSRRKLLQELKILGGVAGGTAVVGVLVGGFYNSYGTIDNLLNPEEEIKLYSDSNDPNSDYAVFRGSTFKFYKETANNNDGVLNLVRRANTKHGSTDIQGDLVTRAVDLFSMLNRNGISTEQRGTFKVRYNGAMGLKRDNLYNIPVYVGSAQ